MKTTPLHRLVHLAVALLALVLSATASATTAEQVAMTGLIDKAKAGDTAAMNELAAAYRDGRNVQKNRSQALLWFTESANAGNTHAYRAIGEIYEKGDDNVKPDMSKAMQWYEAGAKNGSAEAARRMGEIYQTGGKEVGQNYDRAIQAYKRAAELGDGPAMYKIGRMYENGHGVAQDNTEAAKWYNQALQNTASFVSAGDSAIPTTLKDHIQTITSAPPPSDAPETPEAKIARLKAAAARGNADAMLELGRMYRFGNGVPRDEAEAIRLLTEATQKGGLAATQADDQLEQMGRARDGLAGAVGAGVHTPNTTPSSISRPTAPTPSTLDTSSEAQLLAAAQAGDARAMYQLGVMYQNSNPSESQKWLKQASGAGGTVGDAAKNRLREIARADRINEIEQLKAAAKKGDPAAAYKLGDYYYYWEGKNEAEAAKCYRLASGKGNANALRMLGRMHERGEGGLKKDASAAAKWYRKAADKGNIVAMQDLGTLYFGGRGLKQDLKESLKWLTKAGQNGNRDAKDYADELALLMRLRPDEAKRLASSKLGMELLVGYRRDALKGNYRAMENLGFAYYGTMEGVTWARKAAEAGYQQAMVNLADMLSQYRFKNVPRNYGEALKWYLMAGEKFGDKHAMFRAGVLYYFEPGLPKNRDEALKWLRKSGHDNAPQFINRILAETSGSGSSYAQANTQTQPTGKYKIVLTDAMRRYRAEGTGIRDMTELPERFDNEAAAWAHARRECADLLSRGVFSRIEDMVRVVPAQ